jgi:hypothetical protein
MIFFIDSYDVNTHALLLEDVFYFGGSELVAKKKELLSLGYNRILFNLIDLITYSSKNTSEETYKINKSWSKTIINNCYLYYMVFLDHADTALLEEGMFSKSAERRCDDLLFQLFIHDHIANRKDSKKIENKYLELDIDSLLNERCAYLYFHPVRYNLASLYESRSYAPGKEIDYEFYKGLFVDISELNDRGMTDEEALDTILAGRDKTLNERYAQNDLSKLKSKYNKEASGYQAFRERWDSIFEDIDKVYQQHKSRRSMQNDPEEALDDLGREEDGGEETQKQSFFLQNPELIALAEKDLGELTEGEKDRLLLELLALNKAWSLLYQKSDQPYGPKLARRIRRRFAKKG